MSRKNWTIILVVIGVLCIGGALWYPISYKLQQTEQQEQLDELRALHETAVATTPVSEAFTETLVPIPAEKTPEETKVSVPQPSMVHTAEATLFTTLSETPNVSMNQLSDAPADQMGNETILKETEITVAVRPEIAENAETCEINAPEQETLISEAYEDEIVELPIAEEHDVEVLVLSEDEIDALLLPSLRSVYERNHDLIGWLTIPGTEVDHPVMQTPEQNGYYLYKSFDGKDNKNGTLFLDASCDAFTPSRNLIIYGHNMRTGMMFGRLKDYLSFDYWQEHPIIHFDVLTQERTYVVIACVQSTAGKVGENGNFRYTAAFDSEEDLNSWLDYIRRRRRYDTRVDFGTEDRYLTLSTCAYHAENGRLLIIARELRSGEDAQNLEMSD